MREGTTQLQEVGCERPAQSWRFEFVTQSCLRGGALRDVVLRGLVLCVLALSTQDVHAAVDVDGFACDAFA